MKFKIWNDSETSVPTVFIHSFAGDGEEVWNACHEVGCPPFNLVTIYDADFDHALTPWPAEGVRKGQAPFQGKAATHLRTLLEQMMPEIESTLPHPSLYRAMAGYSLAGLFTLWTAWQTTAFKRLACVSASFWYPDFVRFVQCHPMLSHPDCIYFSLGDQESKTRHPLMKEVEVCTRKVVERMEMLQVVHTFEMNRGNHFTESAARMAKAIRWMLCQ